MMPSFAAVDSRYAANIAALTLAGGSAATVFYSSIGLNCPLQSIGLACPGCGCGRAAVALISNGPLVAFQQQPTALLFLASLVLLAAVGRLIWLSQERLMSWFVVLLPVVLACFNLVFQLTRAEKF